MCFNCKFASLKVVVSLFTNQIKYLKSDSCIYTYINTLFELVYVFYIVSLNDDGLHMPISRPSGGLLTQP